MHYVYPPEPWRRRAVLVLRSPARRDIGGCGLRYFEVNYASDCIS